MTMAVQPSPTTSNIQMPGLLRLPLELRNQIYHYLIPTKHIIGVSNPRFRYMKRNRRTTGTEGQDFESSPLQGAHVVDFSGCKNSVCEIVWDDATTSSGTDRKKNSIFLVCKQISNEALDIMYSENAFKLDLDTDGGLCLKKNFSEGNRRRMHLLLLTAQHRNWIEGISPDDTMWSSIIPTLKLIRLVAQQPAHVSHWNAPPFEKEMETWLRFLRAFLNCFQQHLPEGKILEVDFDGNSETAEVVKECLLGGYREVRCWGSGDIVFLRGRFSYNSGYWDNDGPGCSDW